MLKTLKISLILLMLSSSINSQTTYDANYLSSHPRIYTHRQCFWFEGNLNADITSNKVWQFQLDYQYRRTSDPSYLANASRNMFKDPFQAVYRPWIHYWAKPGAIRLSLSPLGYWISYFSADEAKVYAPTRGSGGKYGATVFPEFRVTPQIMFVQKYGRIEFMNRFRYEFRFVGQRKLASTPLANYGLGYNFDPATPGSPINDSTGISQSQRLRWQARVQIPISKSSKKNTLYINAWNELFLSFGKYVGTAKVLNQNRSVALLGYKWAGKVPIKLEVGLTEQIVFFYNIKTPPTQPTTINYNKQNVELNSALQVYLIVDSFQNLFKKEKEKEPVQP